MLLVPLFDSMMKYPPKNKMIKGRNVQITSITLTFFCCRNPQVLLAPNFAYGSGQIFLKNIDCRGSESDIEECTHSEWGVTDCKHAEDVGIDCGKFQNTCLDLYKADSSHMSNVKKVFTSKNLYYSMKRNIRNQKKNTSNNRVT